MSKTEILEELAKLTKTERQEIRLRLAELDSDDWLDDEEPLTVQEKALLEARLAAYAKDPDAGSTWDEVQVAFGKATTFNTLDSVQLTAQRLSAGHPRQYSQLMNSYFLQLGAERARAVGRIVTKTGHGIGTGFLISTRLLMTNNHVIENKRIAALCRIEFDYMHRFDGGFAPTQLFRLLPDDFFLTSVSRDDLNLDYTIIAVEPVNSRGEELAKRGSIPSISTPGDLTVLESANIIQYPGGDPQQVALRDNKVVKSLEHFIHYEADTQPGSSGSPVFNDQWQLAALHHSGVPDEIRPGVYRLQNGAEWDTQVPLPYAEQLQKCAKIKWLSNEGVRISSIIADAQSRLGGDTTRDALFYEAVGKCTS